MKCPTCGSVGGPATFSRSGRVQAAGPHIAEQRGEAVIKVRTVSRGGRLRAAGPHVAEQRGEAAIDDDRVVVGVAPFGKT